MRLKRALLLLALLISFSTICQAKVPEQLVNSFKNLSGVIIMPIDAEYLIDLDASQGVAEGDVFSVITPGEHVIHPVTGKILGNLDKVIGWLQVTRVKNGYSYAKPLGSAKTFTKGTQIRRFENIPALFWDYSGNGEAALSELRTALPHLDWLSYNKAQTLRPESPQAVVASTPRLYFIYRAGQLEVRGADFQLLGQFQLNVAATPAMPSSSVASPAVSSISVPAPAVIVPSEAKQAGGIVYEKKQDNAELWTAHEWSDNPLGVEIADFDGDGANEIAVLFKDHLEVGRVSQRSYQLLSTIGLSLVDKALNMSSADLDGNGRPELFISAVSGHAVSSLVVAEKGGAYQIVQGQLPWFLHAIRDPDGTRVVLGQELGDKINIFSTQIIRLAYRNGRYQSAGDYPHPWGTNIFSLQPFNDQQGEKRFAEISSGDRLRVLTADSDKLWESSKNYGGSLVAFPQEDTTGGGDYATTLIYIKPRLALLDASTVLAPLNEGWRLSDSFQSVGPGQVVALRWDGSSMAELWHSKPQAGSLADFQYADIDNDKKPELVELMLFSRAGLLSKGRAGLRVFEFK